MNTRVILYPRSQTTHVQIFGFGAATPTAPVASVDKRSRTLELKVGLGKYSRLYEEVIQRNIIWSRGLGG